MFNWTPYDLLMWIATLLFVVGLLTLISGVVMLALRAGSGDVKKMVAQTTRLAQKGLAEDVAGLVGNASVLLDSMNQLVRTTTGVGIFLTLLGLAMTSTAIWLAFQIAQMN